jgi:hypothetical protein
MGGSSGPVRVGTFGWVPVPEGGHPGDKSCSVGEGHGWRRSAPSSEVGSNPGERNEADAPGQKFAARRMGSLRSPECPAQLKSPDVCPVSARSQAGIAGFGGRHGGSGDADGWRGRPPDRPSRAFRGRAWLFYSGRVKETGKGRVVLSSPCTSSPFAWPRASRRGRRVSMVSPRTLSPFAPLGA